MAEEKKRRGRPPNPNRVIPERSYKHGDRRRPRLWKSGPDEFRHELYDAYLKRKAQANYRGEGWTMDFEDFYDLWKDNWHLRGRKSHQMCMTRHSELKPWSRENTYIRLRYDILVDQAKKRIGQGHRQLGFKK